MGWVGRIGWVRGRREAAAGAFQVPAVALSSTFNMMRQDHLAIPTSRHAEPWGWAGGHLLRAPGTGPRGPHGPLGGGGPQAAVVDRAGVSPS